ncbi:hypothetical protein HZU75_07580 [Chitinibacter fontanus]|uniref:Uncharacterized protein n=1 Tax=Chitinibacter fontanus TaxID=1737446 RepID=A0A7D5VA54_9NEIS|nr:hypothetical protein [Chitinibacter fontanus]QLI81400.1 hypothetical protein HZU75_07580 [Chitinibacter fontanus]
MIKILTLLFTAFSFINTTAHSQECFEKPPGVEGIRIDTIGEIKISPIKLSKSGKKGYIATEYFGAQNLQASIFLMRRGQYCFAGDLGSYIGAKVDDTTCHQDYCNLIIESKSGSVHFYRTYGYRSKKYIYLGCQSSIEDKKKPCETGEKNENN